MTSRRKLALAVLAIAVLIAAWIGVSEDPRTREIDRSTVEVEPNEPPVIATRTSATDDARRVARARWDERRARIRAAHVDRSRGGSSRDCAEGECSRDATENGGDAVFDSFIAETTQLTQGCEELTGGKPTLVRINAHLIGAPEIGTIVESIEVSGSDADLDALTECLTEGMYALELGDAASSFERDATLIHGLLDEVAGKGWLTAEHAVEIRQQMIDGGLDPAKDPMVAVEADEGSPAE